MSSWRRILGSARLNPIALRNSSAWAEFLLVSRQEDKEASEAPRLTNVSNGRVRIMTRRCPQMPRPARNLKGIDIVESNS